MLVDLSDICLQSTSHSNRESQGQKYSANDLIDTSIDNERSVRLIQSEMEMDVEQQGSENREIHESEST